MIIVQARRHVFTLKPRNHHTLYIVSEAKYKKCMEQNGRPERTGTPQPMIGGLISSQDSEGFLKPHHGSNLPVIFDDYPAIIRITITSTIFEAKYLTIYRSDFRISFTK